MKHVSFPQRHHRDGWQPLFSGGLRSDQEADAANRWPAAMTLIEVKPHRWSWKVFEAPGVEPVFSLACVLVFLDHVDHSPSAIPQ